MSKTFEAGRDEIARLCAYFEKNREAYHDPKVKEAHVRQSLIDPLFEALGWDVRNAGMTAPQYREVIPEESLDVEGERKAPDYTFRVGSMPKFFAEAKKCGVDIGADPAPAYQLRRYGWSAKVALSILTDFEELAVYDCSARPRPADKAGHARVQRYAFGEYPDRWRELWDVFSREAVWSGAFDQYAASKRKRGTSQVDDEFLKDIEGWREELARNIAVRNPGLADHELNRAVQLLIDRVVFLRMAEDRGLEPHEQLLSLCAQPDIYPRFIRDLCRKADDRYNSGLFHFEEEDGISEAPDRLTPRIEVDDKVLKPILQGLYFAHGSPYHFGVLPVALLGTVYERFLGKVIRLTPDHHAKVEEKPEVRKAGGVYYTPAYIVDYIVRETVGRKIEGKSPAQLAGRGGAAPLRVLDMACGSGSFLLGAYERLLDHCLAWYVANDPARHPKALYAARAGDWRLTIEEKKRILTTHLFGVDIDPQAVEVSKLSLLLKVLEDESAETVGNTMRLFHQRALPNLAGNIKCGNSLIGPAWFAGRLPLDPEESGRVNAFDWKAAFPEIMSAGGFDCIIGNPPYVRIQVMKEWAAQEVEIYKRLFRAAREGNYDLYVVFIERGLHLLNAEGRLGFICPHKFFNARYGMPLRGLIAEGRHLSHIVHFGDAQVFAGATTYTCLLFLDKAGAEGCRFVRVNDLEAWRDFHKEDDPDSDDPGPTPPDSATLSVREAAALYRRGSGTPADAGDESVIPARKITATEWNFNVGRGGRLFERLARMPVKLADVTDRIFQGIKTGADTVYIVREVARRGKRVRVYSRQTQAEHWIEAGLLRPLVKGGDSKAFQLVATDRLILFPYENSGGTSRLIPQKTLAGSFPLAWEYLQANRAVLRNREHGKLRGREWYAFSRNQALDVMPLPKVFTPDLSPRAAFSLDAEGRLFFTGGVAGGYGLLIAPPHSREYLLGLLNSRLLDWVHHKTATQMRGGWYSYEARFIRDLPIRVADLTKDADRALHSRIVALVESMLILQQQLVSVRSDTQRTAIQRIVDATDAEINERVYTLYGLTRSEIEIVESGAR
jgi:hypothetical protein